MSYSLAHLAVPYKGRQDARLEPKYIGELHYSFTVHHGQSQQAYAFRSQQLTVHSALSVTSVCEHAYTCLHVSTETYQLIWMPAFTLDIYSC
jgi:hypothetical protein